LPQFIPLKHLKPELAELAEQTELAESLCFCFVILSPENLKNKHLDS